MTADVSLGSIGTTPPPVVLIGLAADGRAVLAVPLARAIADVATFDTIASATTFGQAREHPDAAALVDEWLAGYLEGRREEGDNQSSGAANEPFDAETFFGPDNWWVWRPDARQATVDFRLS